MINQEVIQSQEVAQQSVEENTKKVAFNIRTVSDIYRKGGDEAVAKSFPSAVLEEKKDVGFVNFYIDNENGTRQSVTLNKKGDPLYGFNQKAWPFMAEDSWKFVSGVVNFGKQQNANTEIEFTMIPAGLLLQLAFNEGYWCIGTAGESYANRMRCGRNDLQKALCQTLQQTYGISLNDLERNAVYTFIFAHRNLVPVSINQVFFVKRDFIVPPPKDYKEDMLQLPRLQKFKVKVSCTRQQSGDRDLTFVKNLVNFHKDLAFSYGQPISHIRARCIYRQWELETAAGEAIRLHQESNQAAKPFGVFSRATKTPNQFIAFYNARYQGRRRNNQTEDSFSDPVE